jgi:putative redox protein
VIEFSAQEPALVVEVTSLSQQRLEVSARDVTLVVDRYATAGEPSAGFRATELLLGALGACMVGTALEFAGRQGMPVTGITMQLEEETIRHPTRVGEVAVTMTVRGQVTDEDLDRLRRVAARCKVHNTLASDSGPTIALTAVHPD